MSAQGAWRGVFFVHFFVFPGFSAFCCVFACFYVFLCVFLSFSVFFLRFFFCVFDICLAFLCAFLDYYGRLLLESSEVSPAREDLNSNGNAKAKAKANAQESFPRASKSLRVQKHGATGRSEPQAFGRPKVSDLDE